MSSTSVDKFFELARERYGILLLRRSGRDRPWSTDPIFQREYFCNVFREDDKTTIWFRENMRNLVRNDPRAALLTIVTFRWFNKIEIGKILKDSSVGLLNGKLELSEIEDRILCHYPKGPFVTGAYIIKTPDNMDKLRGVLWCLREFTNLLDEGWFDDLLAGRYSLHTACESLKHTPYLGNFMAWQICSDARFTCLLDKAFDRDTWAQTGPGSARGIGRIYYSDADKFNYGSLKDQNTILGHFKELVKYSKDPIFWPQNWPAWDVSTAQHWACEVDKYIRCEEGGRMKRKYKAV